MAVHLKMFLGKVFHFPEKLSRQRSTEKKGVERVTNQCKPIKEKKKKVLRSRKKKSPKIILRYLKKCIVLVEIGTFIYQKMTYMSVVVHQIVGEFKFVKRHDLFHPLLSSTG